MKKGIEKIESIREFYQRKQTSLPESFYTDIGHFNVFRLSDYIGKQPRPVLYSKRDYFKITLLLGKSEIEYADKTVVLEKQALVFSTPPYTL